MAVADTLTLYLVRHGETEYNRKRIMQGRGINSDLNATGRTQAKALARRFAEIPLDAIYTSALKRADQTAQVIAEAHPDVPYHRLSDLEEMAWGIYEGMPIEPHVSEMFAEMYARWDRGEYDYAVEKGESILDVQRRALRAVETIRAAWPTGTVLILTHGRFLRVLLASLLNEYGLARMQELHHANTAVNRLIWTGDRFEADLLNSTDHLAYVETIMVE